MKDKQLYKYIESALEDKKSLKIENDPNCFADKYVKQQIIKKKLLPYDSNHRINTLMKKFKGLDTFINVPQIIQTIKFKSFHRPIQPSSNQPFIQPKTTTNPLKKRLYCPNANHPQQSPILKQLISELENNSHILSESFKNNSTHDENRLLREIQTNKITNIQSFDSFENKTNSSKIYQKHIDILNFCKTKGLNVQQNKKYTQLLHKATTYLHIILENQYRSKWRANKAQSIENFKKSLSSHKNSTLKNTPYKTNNTTTNSTFHQSYLSNKKQLKFKIKNKDISKLSSKKRTFRQIILKKLNVFIEEINNQQFLISKQNKMYLKTLNKVQKNLTNQFSEFTQQPIANDNDIQEVRKAAQIYKVCNLKK